MVTYKDIQDKIREQYNFVPQSCWIAHVKEMCGVKIRKVHNRHGRRKKPCPDKYVDNIRKVLIELNVVPRNDK